MNRPASPLPPGPVPRAQARVVLSSPGVLSQQDERLLLDVLSGCGLDGSVETFPAHRGESVTLTWIVLASLPLQAFLSALGSKAAEDSYAKLRTLVRRLASARRAHGTAPSAEQEAAASGPAPLILVDARTGLQIVLEDDLPGDAYRELVATDLSKFSVGPLHYDLARHRWRSELDEAAAGSPPSQ